VRVCPGLGPFLVALVAATWSAACPAPVLPRPPAEVSLQLGTRQSCGIFSGLDYDTSCLSALHVVVRDVPGRNVVLESCTTLSDRRNALGDIVRGAPVDRFGGLFAQGKVVFEVHGLHDKGDEGADRCADAAVVDRWLFWGESDPVDLGALDDTGGAIVVPIFVDCRDCAYSDGCVGEDCFGCAGLGSGTCPLDVPESFCVPGRNFECGKRCTDTRDCFGGARACLPSGFCDTAAITGGTCSPCGLVDGVVEGCADGFTCVGPPDATRGFCAESCPERFCVDGTRCNRVGNNLIVIGD
jgi:hypothetical protein